MKPRHHPIVAPRPGRARFESHRSGSNGSDLISAHDVKKPSDISKRGWKQVLLRTKDAIAKDNLSIVAAGVAFYIFFGLIPALGALVSIYGLVADPAAIEQQFSSMRGVLPAEVVQMLNEQMTRIAESATGATWGAAFGILLALWSGSKATKSIITALNIAFGEKDHRGFIRLTLIALGLTLAGVIGVIIAIGLIVALPLVLNYLGGGGVAETVVNILRWPLLAAFAVAGLAAIYRYAPDRDPAKWRWVTWGAGVATVLWLAFSAAFSYYVTNFGSYNKTYGSLGAVIVVLMWLYISAFVILVGAELDAEMEREARELADHSD